MDVAEDRDDWRCCGCSNDLSGCYSGPFSMDLMSQSYKSEIIACQYELSINPFTDEAQTALYKDPVRIAL